MNKIFYRSFSSNWLPLFIGFLLRLINIQLPIVGVHSWRQADTAAIASVTCYQSFAGDWSYSNE